MKLERVEEIASGTCAFYFERPSDFKFVPGQFVEVALEAESPSDPFRSFSIASAPYEQHLMIATRTRDSLFKQALRSLPPGSEVQIDGPYGRFIVTAETPRPLVFLVGGVGITPAMSIIKEHAHDQKLANVYVFYSNRTVAEAPFLKQLNHLQAEHSGLHLIATMTAERSWSGERERISMDMVRRYLDPSQASFYTSGPPGMVKSMREMLEHHGVPRARIWFESFTGY